jgi:hypothetical protein
MTEILGKTVKAGNIYEPATPLFQDFCKKAESAAVLDLCSGSGEASRIFIDSLNKNNLPKLQFYLSDLNPIDNAQKTALPENTSRIEVGIDASSINENDVPQHQARMMIAAFHHFHPQQAKKILQDAVNKQKAIFIVEPFPKRLSTTLPFFLHSFIPGAINPLSCENDRLLKAVFTYLIPIIPLMGWWDTIISALRMYTEEDYYAMVADMDDYNWQYYELAGALNGAITVFTGIPKARVSE